MGVMNAHDVALSLTQFFIIMQQFFILLEILLLCEMQGILTEVVSFAVWVKYGYTRGRL